MYGVQLSPIWTRELDLDIHGMSRRYELHQTMSCARSIPSRVVAHDEVDTEQSRKILDGSRAYGMVRTAHSICTQ